MTKQEKQEKQAEKKLTFCGLRNDITGFSAGQIAAPKRIKLYEQVHTQTKSTSYISDN